PRAAPRAEQRMRASLLARLGAVWSVEPDADLVQRLSMLIPEVLDAAPSSDSSAVSIDLNGAGRVTQYLLDSSMLRMALMEHMA
ncbi:MAG: hypothetical protein KGM46_09535, partial [Pseudomonadota bacterium]|nr:hypothetical protein [Pseudomonadota bacterium]